MLTILQALFWAFYKSSLFLFFQEPYEIYYYYPHFTDEKNWGPWRWGSLPKAITGLVSHRLLVRAQAVQPQRPLSWPLDRSAACTILLEALEVIWASLKKQCGTLLLQKWHLSWKASVSLSSFHRENFCGSRGQKARAPSFWCPWLPADCRSRAFQIPFITCS